LGLAARLIVPGLYPDNNAGVGGVLGDAGREFQVYRVGQVLLVDDIVAVTPLMCELERGCGQCDARKYAKRKADQTDG